MSSPLVTIAIPTFNRATLLSQAIDSALAQTYPNIEVVVVDDGSTDATPALMKARYGNDERVRYHRQENCGTNIARNRAFDRARGEFIALLDSDDLFFPDKIAIQVACLEAMPDVGMIWTDMDALKPDGSLVSRYLRRMYSNYGRFTTDAIFEASRPLAEVVPSHAHVAGAARVYWGDIFGPMVMGNLVHTSTSVIRRDRLAKVRGFDESLVSSGVDFDFHLRTCREGPVAYVDIPTIHYRIDLPDQMTHRSRRVKMAENFLRTITRVLAYDRQRAGLSSAMTDELLAEAEGFLGEAYFDVDDHANARVHLIESLRRAPRNARTIRLLVLSFLPAATKRPLRLAREAMRGPGGALMA